MRQLVIMLNLMIMTLPTLSFANDPIIVFESIKCIETEDWTGGDEALLYFDDEKNVIWTDNINEGEQKSINYRYKMKSNNVNVSLKDLDLGIWADKDDYLGYNVIDYKLNKDNPTDLLFKGDGAHYIVKYRFE